MCMNSLIRFSDRYSYTTVGTVRSTLPYLMHQSGIKARDVSYLLLRINVESYLVHSAFCTTILRNVRVDATLPSQPYLMQLLQL